MILFLNLKVIDLRSFVFSMYVSYILFVFVDKYENNLFCVIFRIILGIWSLVKKDKFIYYFLKFCGFFEVWGVCRDEFYFKCYYFILFLI